MAGIPGARDSRLDGEDRRYAKRAEFPALGTARDFVFELAITDPVKRVIVGGAWITGGHVKSAIPLREDLPVMVDPVRQESRARGRRRGRTGSTL
jgi:hypothetical protein